MRRIVIAIASTITGLVLLFSWPTSLNRTPATAAGAGTTGTGTTTGSTSSSGGGTTTTTPSAQPATATYTGASAQTRYGGVTVQITVTDGKITDAQATEYPRGSRQDQQINAYAIPRLNAEAVQAGSAQIQMISGATFTSYGYIQSLQDAIDQAGL
ncbi:FMN-binding protein [Actinotalea sp. M2MS4P-6]|uniref:FMN-binding protein n=1 Tax=Actinotalea sp. M2MS4P-6 TaxID=2983762 RepID=UPI0021E4CE53|nr:FMN-binding protein [Actinotalea sp. M2MS4P-6]MCV2393149.1 FMN-binding protein [Actinotalea sp. M2MS4P-6]